MGFHASVSKTHHPEHVNSLFTFEECTQTGSDAVHPFSAACLIILCEFLKSKQTTVPYDGSTLMIKFTFVYSLTNSSGARAVFRTAQKCPHCASAVRTLKYVLRFFANSK